MYRSIALWDEKAEKRLLEAHRRWRTPSRILQKSSWIRHRFSLEHISTKLSLLQETLGNTSYYGLNGESEEDDPEVTIDTQDERKMLRKHLKDLQDSLLQAELELSPIYLHYRGRIYAILPLPPRAKAKMHVSVPNSQCTLEVQLPPLDPKAYPDLGAGAQLRKETLRLKLPLSLPTSPKQNIRYEAINRVEWYAHTAIWRIPHGDTSQVSKSLGKRPNEAQSFRV